MSLNIASGKIAFWMHPEGRTYQVHTSHIDFVFDNTEIFMVSKEYLRTIYRQYKEPFRFEGKARKVIIRNLVSQGWIRIRLYYRPSYHWSFQCHNLSEYRHHITSFLQELFQEGLIEESDRIKISDREGETYHTAREFLSQSMKIKTRDTLRIKI